MCTPSLISSPLCLTTAQQPATIFSCKQTIQVSLSPPAVENQFLGLQQLLFSLESYSVKKITENDAKTSLQHSPDSKFVQILHESVPYFAKVRHRPVLTFDSPSDAYIFDQ